VTGVQAETSLSSRSRTVLEDPIPVKLNDTVNEYGGNDEILG